MSDKAKHRFSTLVLIVVIIFALGVSWFFIWLLRPYPRVTVAGNSKIINMPVDGVFKTGDLIRWVTPEVCQPNGRTTAEITAVLTFDTEYGQAGLRTDVVNRDFNLPVGFPTCTKNNQTTVYVDGDLATGTYHFEIKACVYNPTPQPECNTFNGPSDIRIERKVNNE